LQRPLVAVAEPVHSPSYGPAAGTSMRRIRSFCCAGATSGQAAALLSVITNSRRRMQVAM
jgi:hypothetical protein